MTVSTFDRRIPYPGNDVATVFAGPRAFLASDLSAYLTEDATGTVTVLAQDTDYTITGLGLTATDFTLAEAPATGFTLTLLRTLEYTQNTRFTNQGAFFAKLHEDEFDRGAMCDQQLADLISELSGELDGTIEEVNQITQDLITQVSAFDQRVTNLEETLVIEFPAASRMSFLELACSYRTGTFEEEENVARFTVPFDFTLVGIRGSVKVAQTSGDEIIVDMNRNGASLLDVKLHIDNGELSSTDDPESTEFPVFTEGGTALLAGDVISFDRDQVGDGTARGLQVTVWGYQTVAP